MKGEAFNFHNFSMLSSRIISFLLLKVIVIYRAFHNVLREYKHL